MRSVCEDGARLYFTFVNNFFCMVSVFLLAIACIALSISCVLLFRRVKRLEKDLYSTYDSIPKF